VFILNITRRHKYSGHGRTITNTDTKVLLNFDLMVLNLMCTYIISENSNIRRSHLINMRNLFEIMNLDVFNSDREKLKRVMFIKKGLEARLLANLSNPILIIKYINGGIIDDDVIDINNFTFLSNSEIDFINDTVSSALKYAFIDTDADKLMDILTRFKASDYKNKGTIVAEFETCIDEIKGKFRRAKANTTSNMMFSLREGVMEESIQEVYDKVANPNRRLVTGMQGFNELIGGAFELTRSYLILGLAAAGKSFTLLNLAYQIKKYNKGYKPKDPTKIPVIVYLTMENTVEETVERLFSLTVVNDHMKNYTVQEIIHRLRTEGELYLTDESPIDIVIKYVPDKSVDTGYLYTLTEDLEDEGYEVICMIQDHIKRIRSTRNHTDLRLELGEVVNECVTFARLKEVVFITDAHINREGAKTVDTGKQSGKADLTRMLGRSNIGESMLMIDNIDCSVIIGPEYDQFGNKYMAFNRIKCRMKTSDRYYICQPFVNGNEIKLVEDLYSPVPVFKEGLTPTLQMTGNTNKFNNVKPSQYNNIKVLEDRLIEDDDNIYLAATRYSSTEDNELGSNLPVFPVLAGIRADLQKSKLINPISFINHKNIA
jgi:hypothetical protein